MKTPISVLATFSTILAITLTSCHKKDQAKPLSPTIVHADDQVQVAAEIDAVLDEANILLFQNDTLKFGATKKTICDASFKVDSTTTTKSITITYNGNNCGPRNRTRSGSVLLTLPKTTNWNDVGTVLTIKYQDVSVHRVSDQHTIRLNGTAIVTNLSGGTVQYLEKIKSTRHELTSSGITIKFPNDSSRTWMLAKQRDFSYEDGIRISITGKHSESGVSNIAQWGINRSGESFQTSIDQPVVVKESCLFRITNGKMTSVTSKQLAITYGLGLNGVPIECPGYNPYYFSASYTDAGTTEPAVIWAY